MRRTRQVEPGGRDLPPSVWVDTCNDSWQPRPCLHGDLEVDTLIIGGGYSGLWAAYWLQQLDPGRRVAVVEAQVCGFGASGRNGGWASALLPHPRADLVGMMRAAVDELGETCAHESIDCDFAKGGTFTLARNPAHLEDLQQLDEHSVWLDAEQVRSEFAVAGALGAAFTADCAALHPAKLVRQLASVVQRHTPIYEHSRVERYGDQRALVMSRSGRFEVRYRSVLRCTEGYSADLAQAHRELVPIASMMIATEPLSASMWDEIGLQRRSTFTDGRALIVYGQRTADDRIVFGGRGAPYRFGSGTSVSTRPDSPIFGHLEAELHRMLPQLEGTTVTHRWGGVLGVARDYDVMIDFDPSTGEGFAGGFVGDGVTTSFVAGRTLAELVTGTSSVRTDSSLVRSTRRRWEPEPLRWVGINAATALAGWCDRSEAATQRKSRVARRLLERLTGG